MKKNNLVAPIVKWAGGKRQLLPELLPLIPQFTTYYEPFVGGGALLFELQPRKAVINDFNHELINTYEIIKKDVDAVIKDLRLHKNDADYYYQLREMDRNNKVYSALSDVQKASRLLYLNKTCYNGLFRVNSAGEFNSPFGNYKSPNIVNEVTLKAVSNYFNSSDITFKTGDFEVALQGIKKGSFVYLDPPYDPVSVSANFTGYTNLGFGREEQIRLKRVCDKLHAKGVNFLLSNSATAFIRELYTDYTIKTIPARRIINSNAMLRGDVEEVLIQNYEP